MLKELHQKRLEFDLERATDSLFEVGKNLMDAFVTCLGLGAAATILLTAVKDQTIDTEWMEIDRNMAVQILVLLTVLAFTRFLTLTFAQQILGIRVWVLREELYQESAGRWSSYYPSVYNYSRMGSAFEPAAGRVWRLNELVIVAVGVFVPLGLQAVLVWQSFGAQDPLCDPNGDYLDWCAWRALLPTLLILAMYWVLWAAHAGFDEVPKTVEQAKETLEKIENNEVRLFTLQGTVQALEWAYWRRAFRKWGKRGKWG